MKRFSLKLFLFNLIVFSTILSFGQIVPPTSAMNGSQLLNGQASSLQSQEFELPDYSSTNQTEINNAEFTSNHQNQNVVESVKSEFSMLNGYARGFDQDTAKVLYSEDFDPATWSATPEGWYVAGKPSENWRVFSGNSAGGTTPEAYFIHYPGFSGYTKLVIDTTLNTSGYNTLALGMKTFLQYAGAGYTARVETTSDGGTTWNTAWEKLVNANFADSIIIIINTPDVGSENFQFAITFEGSTTTVKKFTFDDLLLTEGPAEVYDITFNLKDIDENAVEDARITLEGYGTLFTDINGQAVYKNVIPGDFVYSITGKDLAIINDSLTLSDEHLVLDIEMVEPIYIYYEDFTVEPNGWIKHFTPSDRIYWVEGGMQFLANGAAETILYVTPAIDLYKDSTITIEVGGANNDGTIGVGFMADPNDTLSYTEFAQFELESAYRYYEMTLPDTITTSKHIGFKHLGGPGADFILSTMYIVPKSIYTPRKASFIVKDAQGEFMEGAEVSLDRNGTKTTDSLGQVSFNSVFVGTYDFSVHAGLDYSRASGTIEMEQTDTLVNVVMQDPAYYFFDDFSTGQVSDWTYHKGGTDGCRWSAGRIMYYNSDPASDSPMIAVTPEIDISNVESVTVYAGGNENGSGVLYFGTLSDKADTATFTPLTSFKIGSSYQYFSANISEYSGTDKYFGFRGVGPEYNFFYIDMVFMEAKASTEKQAVTFIVKDEEANLYEGAQVSIPGFGPVYTNSDGEVVMNLHSHKDYTWTISADDLFAKQRDLSVIDAAKTVNVTMKNKADYFMLEEFETGIPFNWTKVITAPDGLEWWNGEINFYNYLDSEDPLMIVSPEMDLTKVDAVSVEIGQEYINHGGITIGALTDPTDFSTFQTLGLVESELDFDFYTVDVSDIDIKGSYLAFKNEGTYPSYMVLRTIYVEGHGASEYCMDSTVNKDGWIANVKFDEIDNASDWQSEVADYTHLATRIQPGNSEFITVTNGNPKANDAVTVWVDWDNNFEYEVEMGEEYVLSSTDDGATFTAEIAIPEGIEYGRFPMRIRMTNDAAPLPCGVLNDGETEDYVLKVMDELDPVAGIVFADNFDTYTAGQMVACQNLDFWTTTDLDPCGAKDALVINDQAYSGENAANIISGDDLVMDLDRGFTTGKHTISSMLYIPTGGKAQINILSAFNPTIEHAFEAIFSNNGTGSVNADSSAAATFEFTNDAWMECKVVVDLNNDEAEFYLNDVSIITWQWTKGATGEGSALQLAAVNFSGATGGSNYYIDDVSVETLPVYPPLNFSAAIAGGDNVEMEWNAPRGEENMRWDNGNRYSALGLWGNNFSIASRWTPEDLEAYDGNYITSISFIPNEEATFTLKVWTGGNAETLLISQEVSDINVGSNTVVELDHPVLINAFEELWFGYEVSNYSGYPAGLDRGPAVSEKGEMFSMDGVNWITLTSIRWDYNWNIAAFASASTNGKTIAQPMAKENITSATDLAYAASLKPGVITCDNIEDHVSDTKRSGKTEEGFVGYSIYRNGEVIKDSLSKTSFVDTSVMQGSYAYEVKAIYNEGISASAKPGAININVGALVPRDVVIIEVGTGTWCVNCPGVAMACEEMVENGHSVGIIEYHSGDEYQTTEAISRIDYYGISGYPTSYFDGLDNIPGGNPSTSLYPSFVPKYNDRMAVATPVKLESFFYNTNENNYTVDIKTELVGGYENLENLRVFAALTESHIADEWFGMETVDFALRDMIPNQNGTEIDFASDSVQSFQLDYKYYDVYNPDNMELVVFVQDVVSKEILQGTIALEGEPPLAAPYNLTSSNEVLVDTDFVISWDAPDAGDNNFASYNVYRQLGDKGYTMVMNTTEVSYTDNVVEAGVVSYYVTAVYDEGESSASNILAIDVVTSVEESIFNNTSLYPNPASKVVNITSEYSIEEVSVFNYLGQEIFTEEVNSKLYKMNTSDFESGIYLFHIKTSEGQIAKQIIIE